jgi:surface antigen
MLKRTSSLFAVALISTFGLNGCAETRGNNATTGALIGGVTGALAASSIGSGSGRVAATMLGAFAGTVIGSELGQYLDEIDRQKADDAFVSASHAPIGKTIHWNNPNTGHHGAIKTVRDGSSQEGEYCREFQSQITVGGKVQDAYGTACQKTDGSWQIIS